MKINLRYMYLSVYTLLHTFIRSGTSIYVCRSLIRDLSLITVGGGGGGYKTGGGPLKLYPYESGGGGGGGVSHAKGGGGHKKVLG